MLVVPFAIALALIALLAVLGLIYLLGCWAGAIEQVRDEREDDL